MKVIAVLLALLAVAAAERFTGTIDWSEVKPVEELPHFWKNIPKPARNVFPKNGGSRIVGGEFAEPHQFPYQVANLINFPQGRGLCGGSILSPKFILTAAHCVDGSSNSGVVILGAHNISDISELNTKITFNKVHQHETYDPSQIKDDIAIIELSEPVEFSKTIKAIRLPTKSEAESDFAGEKGLVSGWGRFKDSVKDSSDVLRFVENPVMLNAVCGKYFFGLIGPTQICMSGKGGHGSCQGDSGGPMVVKLKAKESTQVGVVSFGIALGCELGFPTAFTRVGSYLDWIEGHSDVKIVN